VPLTDGLAAYYRFQSDGADASGNGQTLTLSNQTFGPGKLGNCLLTGSGNRAQLAGLSAATAVSITGWVRCPRSGLGQGYAALDFFGPRFGLVVTDAPPSDVHVQEPATGLSADVPGVGSGTFLHLAATYDGTTTRLYVNGSQVAATAGGPAGWQSLPLTVNTDALVSTPLPWDEVGVWARALTPAEVSALHAGGSGLDPTVPPSPNRPEARWSAPPRAALWSPHG